MREQYVAGLAALLPAGSHTLLISFEYVQAIKAGPPFSVESAEISRLYGPHFAVEPNSSATTSSARARSSLRPDWMRCMR